MCQHSFLRKKKRGPYGQVMFRQNLRPIIFRNLLCGNDSFIFI